MNIADRPLNYQAIALEEAETELRLLVKDEFLKRTPRSIIDSKAREIIKRALSKIKIPNLAFLSEQSLTAFYLRQQREIHRISGQKLLVLLSLIKLTDRQNEVAKSVSISQAKRVVMSAIDTYNETYGTDYDRYNIYGVPLQQFSQDYINRNVKPTLNRMIRDYAKDPDDIEDRNSLRNKAEMEVRYQSHLDSIGELKENGVKLVIVSEHADCSERCRPYQGRVFSLDGTSGTTSDGRRYVPLSNATDVYYTTKAGKTYKNGLLGFNCRHYLVPYKDGFRFPKPNPKIEAKEYEITEKQRYLERQVRQWRTRAIIEKSIDLKKYRKARDKAIAWNKKYIEYSKANGRAFYPSRTKLI